MAHQTGGESQKREADTDSGPRLASVNAAVAVAGDNKLIFGKNADRSVPIASVTKVMTALVVLESGEPLDEWVARLGIGSSSSQYVGLKGAADGGNQVGCGIWWG